MLKRSVPSIAALLALAVAGAACDEPPTAANLTSIESTAQFARGGPGANASEDAMVWTANLKPLNAHVTERAVTGKATFTVDMKAETFTAAVFARGVAPDVPHPQHIHGFLNGTDAACPTPKADTDGDKIVSLEEGAVVYGGVLVPLDTDLVNEAQQIPLFPVSEDYDYTYEQTISLEELYDYPGFEAGGIDLAIRHVVIHGAFMDGSYNAVLPVACGELKRIR